MADVKHYDRSFALCFSLSACFFLCAMEDIRMFATLLQNRCFCQEHLFFCSFLFPQYRKERSRSRTLYMLCSLPGLPSHSARACDLDAGGGEGGLLGAHWLDFDDGVVVGDTSLEIAGAPPDEDVALRPEGLH